MRDFHFHSGHKFGEALRAAKAEGHGSMVMRGEQVPEGKLEGLPSKNPGGVKRNRKKAKKSKVTGFPHHVKGHPPKAHVGEPGFKKQSSIAKFL